MVDQLRFFIIAKYSKLTWVGSGKESLNHLSRIRKNHSGFTTLLKTMTHVMRYLGCHVVKVFWYEQFKTNVLAVWGNRDHFGRLRNTRSWLGFNLMLLTVLSTVAESEQDLNNSFRWESQRLESASLWNLVCSPGCCWRSCSRCASCCPGWAAGRTWCEWSSCPLKKKKRQVYKKFCSSAPSKMYEIL